MSKPATTDYGMDSLRPPRGMGSTLPQNVSVCVTDEAAPVTEKHGTPVEAPSAISPSPSSARSHPRSTPGAVQGPRRAAIGPPPGSSASSAAASEEFSIVGSDSAFDDDASIQGAPAEETYCTPALPPPPTDDDDDWGEWE